MKDILLLILMIGVFVCGFIGVNGIGKALTKYYRPFRKPHAPVRTVFRAEAGESGTHKTANRAHAAMQVLQSKLNHLL